MGIFPGILPFFSLYSSFKNRFIYNYRIIPAFLKSNHCVHSFSVVLEDLYFLSSNKCIGTHTTIGSSFLLIYTTSQTLLRSTWSPSLQKSLLWNIFMPYTMDVVTSLVATKQNLGVGKEMQGGDSLQSFLLTLHFFLFVRMSLLILQTLKLWNKPSSFNPSCRNYKCPPEFALFLTFWRKGLLMLTHITSLSTPSDTYISSSGAVKQIFSLWTMEILLVIPFGSCSLVHTQLCQCSITWVMQL